MMYFDSWKWGLWCGRNHSCNHLVHWPHSMHSWHMMQVTCLYRPAVQFGSPAAAQQWRLLSVCTISWPLIGGGKLVLHDLTLYVLSELHFPIWLKHTFPFEYKSNSTLTLYHYIILYYTISIFFYFLLFLHLFFYSMLSTWAQNCSKRARISFSDYPTFSLIAITVTTE